MAYDKSISKDDWIKNKGTGKAYHLSLVSLPNTEIQELFKNKVLSNDLLNIFDGLISVFQLKDDDIYNFGRRAKESGVLMVLPFASKEEYLLFMENFLLLCFWHQKSELSLNPSNFLVVPYTEIRSIKSNWNFTTVKDEDRVIEKGNPALGAAMGGIIAGPTGAIIGAASNIPKQEVIYGAMRGYDTRDIYIDMNSIGIPPLKHNDYHDFKISALHTYDLNVPHDNVLDISERIAYIMNSVILNKDYPLDKFESYEQFGSIFNDYMLNIEKIINNAPDFNLRQRIIDYINNSLSIESNINKYYSNEDFIFAIKNIIKDCRTEPFNKINEIVNLEVKEYEDMIKNTKLLLQELEKLENEYDKIPYYKLLAKHNLKNEIENKKIELEDVRDVIIEYKFSDISKKIIQIIENNINE